MNKTTLFFLFLSLLLLACQEKAELRTYQQKIPAPAQLKLNDEIAGKPSPRNPYEWLAPPLETTGPKSMRIAGFDFKSADISISRFPGSVGDLTNLRWAQQISLSPTQEARRLHQSSSTTH